MSERAASQPRTGVDRQVEFIAALTTTLRSRQTRKLATAGLLLAQLHREQTQARALELSTVLAQVDQIERQPFAKDPAADGQVLVADEASAEVRAAAVAVDYTDKITLSRR